jgi:hypothetical protein
VPPDVVAVNVMGVLAVTVVGLIVKSVAKKSAAIVIVAELDAMTPLVSVALTLTVKVPLTP